MITVIADKYIRAERLQEFIELAKQLVQATNENDSGCIRYELLQDSNDPQHFTIFEEWADREALTVHSEAEHFKSIVPRLAEFAEKPGEVHLLHTLA